MVFFFVTTLFTVLFSGEKIKNKVLITGQDQDIGASCLDGSPVGYWWDKGITDPNKWIIHLQGGGWCWDITDCANRKSTTVGSSKNWPKETYCYGSCDGILSSIKSENPIFFGWTKVFTGYCDGSSWTSFQEKTEFGNDSVKITEYHRGKPNLKAIFSSMLSNGLRNATNVILTGSSAGGLSVLLHANLIQSWIPLSVDFRVLADAGWFLDHENRYGVPTYEEQAKSAMGVNLWNSLGGLNTKCVEMFSEENSWQCFFAQTAYQFVDAPVFILEAKYDSWQMGNILGLKCNLVPYHSNTRYKNCTQDEVSLAREYGESMFRSITGNLKNSTGVFLSSCNFHATEITEISKLAWDTVLVNGKTAQETFTEWYVGTGEGRSIDMSQMTKAGQACNPTCLMWTNDDDYFMY